MKTLFLSYLFFLVAGISTNASATATKNYEYSSISIFPVNLTLVSREGCKFVISGEFGWLSGFSGTVTASGDGDCPNDTWTFGIKWNDNDEPYPVGDNEFTRYLLSHPDDLKMVADAIRNAQN